MNCIDCSYSLLKDGHSKCTYEEGECIKISLLEKENAELKNKLYKAKEQICNLLYVYQLGKNELAIVRRMNEAEQFLKQA